MKRKAAILLVGVILMLTLFGCGGGKTYRVDYGGHKDWFVGARDAYRAGKQVTLYYNLIGTDTDYRFLLDGEPLHTDYNHKKGFILRFTMPDHDVKLTVESHNSMVVLPPTEDRATLTFDSFYGGGPEYSVEIDDPSIVTYQYDRSDDDKGPEETDGGAYTVYYTFRGLRPGETVVKVFSRSPIADDYDEIYLAVVNDDLHVTLELQETVPVGAE